jgi:cytochrome c peroxidase
VLDPLLLNVEVADRTQILAFLDALGDGSFDQTIPERVPSGLRPGGDIGP